MADAEQLRHELEIAARIAASLTDVGASRDVQRYMREVEDKLLYEPRPIADTYI